MCANYNLVFPNYYSRGIISCSVSGEKLDFCVLYWQHVHISTSSQVLYVEQQYKDNLLMIYRIKQYFTVHSTVKPFF
uniref:Uncharacterized protein n=1 Tax=Oryza brachyantha TaxID=4533 RepID=J3L3X9_ORYBR